MYTKPMSALFYLRASLRRHVRALVLGALSAVCANAVALIGPFILQQAIDSLGRTHPAFALWQYAVLIVAAALLQAVFSFGTRWSINGASRRIEYELRNRLFAHFQRLELEYFQQNKVGDLVARATNDLSAVRMMLGPGISGTVNTVVAFVATMTVMLLLDLRLALVSGVFLPVITVAFVLLRRRMEKLFRQVQDQFGDISSAAQENFSGIRVVKAYVQEEQEITAFSLRNRDYLERSMRYARITAVLWPAMSLFAGLSVAVILWIGGTDVIDGRLTLGQFIQFNSYLGQLAWPMIALGFSLNLFQQGDASLARLREVWEHDPTIADRPAALVASSTPGAMRGDITFEHVRVSYDSRAILRDISLHIPAGQTVAVVGATGAGKSTLLNLLPRVIDVTAGRVMIDGIDVRDWPLDALRRQIGYVLQENFLFSVPLHENISYGVGEDEATPEAVAAVAGTAQLAADIADFLEGYHTTVGERGVTLSGGQKQRTALARALMKSPRLLLLDDALSSVDTRTEEHILQGLRQARAGGTTTLIVSHRVSTVRDADLIVVLDDGRIAETGTHQALIARGGLYAAMYRRQLLSEEMDAV